MVKHWNSLFPFLKQPDLFEPTNNAAERDLRLLVRLRRISQGSRSLAGQLWTARAATVSVQREALFSKSLETALNSFIKKSIKE